MNENIGISEQLKGSLLFFGSLAFLDMTKSFVLLINYFIKVTLIAI